MMEIDLSLPAKLRRLADLIEKDSDALLARAFGFRIRYVPIMKALQIDEALTLRDISRMTGLSHSAVSQTVARMIADGFVVSVAGEDGRHRKVSTRNKLRDIMPEVEAHLEQINHAIEQVELEMGKQLVAAVDDAAASITARPLTVRSSQ